MGNRRVVQVYSWWMWANIHVVPREGGGAGETDRYWGGCKDQVESGMFATWGPKSDKTSTEEVEVESTKKRRMEDKRCMERRFISFDKVEYIMIYMCILV